MPVGWARFGPLSRFIARRIPSLRPPLLLLAFPRSGSSWVGEILGSAEDALYLREPFSQGLNVRNGRKGTVTLQVDAAYGRDVERAFLGLPAFPERVVLFPQQWGLRGRSAARVVIKEVNPLAAEWLITAYRPRVILLIRHPAAIALSYRRLGWGWDRLDLARFGPYLDTILRPWRTLLERAQGFWEWHGVLQGAALRVAKEALDAWQDHRVVRYEDLCEAPLPLFRDLYAFGGLSWSGRIKAVVEGKSSGGDRDDPYQTTRPSREMAFRWRGHVGQADLEHLRAAYTAFNLPWYTTSNDW